MKYLIIALLISFSTACSSTGTNELSVWEQNENKTFVLDTLNNNNFSPLETNQKPTIKISIKDGKLFVSGNATCNNYSGQVRINNDSYTVKALMVTRMMCAGGRTAIEREFLALLRDDFKISYENGVLSLNNGLHKLSFKEM